jgi:acetyltransferase
MTGAAPAPPGASAADAPVSAAPRLPRFGAGDGIRGLACLYVVLHHVARHTGTQHLHAIGRRTGDPIDVFGSLGGPLLWGARSTPYIFFALSGFVLSRPFVRGLVGGNRMPSVGRYARSRALRIIPAFWLTWALTFLIEGTHGATVKDVALDISFLQTSHPNPGTALLVQGWTLSVELGFYFALPLAALGFAYLLPKLPQRDISRGGWLLIALAGGGLISLVIRAQWGHPVWRAMFPEYLIAFTPGLMLAVAEQMWSQRVRGSQAVRQVVPLLVVGSVVALAWHSSLRGGDLLSISISGTLVAACLLTGALLYEWNTGRAWRLFANPVSDWIGERSYGIYLLHFLILRELAFVGDGIHSLGLQWLVRAAVAVPATLIAADLSYRFLERPAINWGKRERRPLTATPTQPEAIAP